MGDRIPAMPFTVIPDVPEEPLMEVSSSPFETSSGSGSAQSDSLPPTNTALVHRSNSKGRGGEGKGDDNDRTAFGRHVRMNKWDSFVQQNQLNINIDPSIIERYVES